MLVVRDLAKRYPGPRGEPHRLFDHLSFELGRGGRLAVLGRNGQGKSTLIKILGGVVAPSAGEVRWSMTASWPMGFGGGFQGGMTGIDNIRFLARIYRRDPAVTLARVEAFAELGEALEKPVRFYSSGMRARLAFGLSLAIEFDCYLIDEVTAVGDLAFIHKCERELFERRADRAFIIATHDLALVRRVCDRAIVIERGRAKMFEDVETAMAIYATLCEETETAGREVRNGMTTQTPLTLPRERFFHGDAPGEPCPETIDLTGLGRILVYGPYEPVTSGLWTATLRLEVCADGAMRPFQFDVVTGADVTETRFRPGRPGAFSVQARHTVDAAAPLELRLWVMKPTFHGELRLLGATLERAGGDGAE